MVSHAAGMIWHNILCNHTGKYKYAGYYICLELNLARLSLSLGPAMRLQTSYWPIMETKFIGCHLIGGCKLLSPAAPVLL